MNKFFYYLMLLLAVFTMSACSDSDSSSDGDDSTQEETTYRRSVIIYLAAQNSLGYAGAARLDSAEIVSGFTLHNNTSDNVFLFIDDGQPPRIYRIYRYSNRTHVDKVYTWSDDVYSTDPATLYETLSFVRTNYPSTSYGLVLWSHGNGWQASTSVVNTLDTSVRAFGVDVGASGDMVNDVDSTGASGSQMDICDMAEAISQSGVHLDYIFFDACEMQCIEVAYELKDVTDYVVGSASSTSAYGAYYTNLVPEALFAYPANDENVSLIATQFYYDAVENTALSRYYGDMGDVISVVKTSGLEALAEITATLLPQYISDGATVSLSNVQVYGNSELFYMPDYADMGSFMHSLLSDDDYEAWLERVNDVIITHKESTRFIIGTSGVRDVYGTITDPDNVQGISCFVPQYKYSTPFYTDYNEQFKSTAWYRDAGWEATGWLGDRHNLL